MHPVETGLAFAVMKGVVGGKQDEIAFFPENEVPKASVRPTSAPHGNIANDRPTLPGDQAIVFGEDTMRRFFCNAPNFSRLDR